MTVALKSNSHTSLLASVSVALSERRRAHRPPTAHCSTCSSRRASAHVWCRGESQLVWGTDVTLATNLRCVIKCEVRRDYILGGVCSFLCEAPILFPLIRNMSHLIIESERSFFFKDILIIFGTWNDWKEKQNRLHTKRFCFSSGLYFVYCVGFHSSFTSIWDAQFKTSQQHNERAS